MTVKTADIRMMNKETAAPVKRRFFLAMPKRADRSILISILVLAAFGLLMIASSSMGLTVGRPGRLALILIKQFVFLGAGYYFMARLANNFKLSFLKSGSFPVWQSESAQRWCSVLHSRLPAVPVHGSVFRFPVWIFPFSLRNSPRSWLS